MKRGAAGGRQRRGAMALLAVAVLQVLEVPVADAGGPARAEETSPSAPVAAADPPLANPPDAAAQSPVELSPANPAPAATSLERLRETQRSTTAALLMSLPCPGWGQLYADAPFWGSIAFGVQMFYLGNVLMELKREDRQRRARDLEPVDSEQRDQRDLLITEHRERARDFVWWAAAGLLVIALDAYVSVSLVDFDEPGVPVPELGPDPEQGADGAGAALSLSWRF